jgi:glucose-6-phosphate-specific signal transduction histidine kinase
MKTVGKLFTSPKIIVASSLILYIIVFYFMHKITGSVFAFSVLPPIFGGWFFGRKGGVCFGLLMLPVVATQQWIFVVQGSQNPVLEIIIGTVGCLVVGAAVGTIRDIKMDLENKTNELKKTQVQLIETAKLRSIGTLAAGIAHELNNP